jgi:RNA polymerase sigma-70 factor (sigma-E family)
VSPPVDDFREFAASRAPSLHRTAYLLCGDWHLADDLVQEALAKAFRHWRRVQRADNPDAYVRRILVNESNQHWRRHRRVDLSAALTDEIDPAPDAADEIVRNAELLQALLKLTARQRATVVMRYLEGRSERETAQILGCSEGTVKSQTFRALNRLKTVLNRPEILL